MEINSLLPDERIERGKSEHGKITCRVEKADTSISIIIKDDGKGIDIQKIKDKAIKKGLIDQDGICSLTDSQLVDIIFSDSFSTKDEVNELSGRGYGLSAVMKEIKKINGVIEVDTAPGEIT
ncbi:MAG TPA: ATP-binding protein [Ruminiclostridium sp.]